MQLSYSVSNNTIGIVELTQTTSKVHDNTIFMILSFNSWPVYIAKVGSTTSRAWNILVTQLACTDPWRWLLIYVVIKKLETLEKGKVKYKLVAKLASQQWLFGHFCIQYIFLVSFLRISTWHEVIVFRAPDDCLQYYTGTSGEFKSFNFANGRQRSVTITFSYQSYSLINHPILKNLSKFELGFLAGQLLSSQAYRVCFRQELGQQFIS